MYTTAAMTAQKKGLEREYLVNDEWLTPNAIPVNQYWLFQAVKHYALTICIEQNTTAS